MLLDAFGFALLLECFFAPAATAAGRRDCLPANLFAIRTDSQNELIRANPISIRTTPNANGSTQLSIAPHRLADFVAGRKAAGVTADVALKAPRVALTCRHVGAEHAT